MKKEWFSIDGRLARKKFIFRCIIIYILGVFVGMCAHTIVCTIYFFGSEYDSSLFPEIAQITGQIIGDSINLILIPILAKRWHDLNRSGMWIITFFLIPMLSWIPLLFFKGTTGSNRYGEDPLSRSPSPNP
ncbi:MAG: DUF805 domain-containing protein [Acidaminococcales bacterium]|jgi:uncharacterized membrane protein YhaH (DUF805 family)|nr:DUF805 domain-containing protein [Acidaminococcales bacterium]